MSQTENTALAAGPAPSDLNDDAQTSLERLVPKNAKSLPKPPFSGLLAFMYLVKYDPRYNYAFHIDPKGACELFELGTRETKAILDINTKAGELRADRFKELISKGNEDPLGLRDSLGNEIVDGPPPPPFW